MHKLLLITTIAVALSAPAEPRTRFTAAAGSRLVLAGSSNVKDWRCTGRTIEVVAEVAAPLAKINEVIDRIEDGAIGPYMSNPAALQFPPPELELSIPVKSLRCGNAQMERDMFEALKADRFDAIRFRFSAIRGAVTHDIDQHSFHATIAGVLALAGTRRELSVEVTVQRLGRDRFRLSASLPLRMTDFNVTPPTALFGMVKARNELVVRFELVLQEDRS